MGKQSSPGSVWVKCISTQGNIRGVAIQATELIQSMVDTHHLEAKGAHALGEAVVGGLLIASCCKPGERINLNIQGTGDIKQALVDAYPDGKVRGYVIEQAKDFVPDESQGPWGEGLLSVLRTKDEEGGKPYIGTVPLLTGHLAKDLSFYWVQSEQIPSAVGLAISMNGSQVISAGGFLVQALPSASTEEVKTIEQHIQEIESLSKIVLEDASPMHLLSQIFQSTAFVVVEERALKSYCNCSWERVQRAMTLIGVDELQSILEEDENAEIRCDFCEKEYRIDKAELKRMIDQIRK